jgi:tRNA (cmo5U34)-methyltransferase
MIDEIIVSGKWEFDKNVTDVFENMLIRSIPQYDVMRELVFRIGERFVIPNTCIIDLGCSNGLAIEPFINKFGAQNTYKLFDESKPMLEACRKEYNGWEKAGIVDIKEYDLRQGVPSVPSSLILSILTLQFTPIEYRQKIVKSVYDSLHCGGAFILVEKVIGGCNDIDEMFTEEYLQLKRRNLYTQEQIDKKRKSLEGVLVPITESWNVDMLKNAGFKKVECFWRCLNFCGWIAIK